MSTITIPRAGRERVLPVLLTQAAVAKSLSVSPRTLEGWRVRGDGPPFKRLAANIVRYDMDEVRVWLKGVTE